MKLRVFNWWMRNCITTIHIIPGIDVYRNSDKIQFSIHWIGFTFQFYKDK